MPVCSLSHTQPLDLDVGGPCDGNVTTDADATDVDSPVVLPAPVAAAAELEASSHDSDRSELYNTSDEDENQRPVCS